MLRGRGYTFSSSGGKDSRQGSRKWASVSGKSTGWLGERWAHAVVWAFHSPVSCECHFEGVLLQSSDQLLLVTRYSASEMEVYPVNLRVNS